MHVVLTLVQKRDEFAMLQRLNGRWTFPGGKIEDNESVGDAAYRETREETGMEIDIIDVTATTSDEFNFYAYVHAAHKSGDLKLAEPDKFLKVEWMKAAQVLELCHGQAPIQVLNLLESVDSASKMVAPKSSGLHFG